ncbi:hypothetical protein ASZ90_016464 [hydrocarbon metagenome]|uniref:Uncharacterized protein n=1 Tax=hydrocarbon metagenome TaxID=938273 RepID=A0A0W8EUE7_9ZZZZ
MDSLLACRFIESASRCTADSGKNRLIMKKPVAKWGIDQCIIKNMFNEVVVTIIGIEIETGKMVIEISGRAIK